jgi:hypothetical protein
MSFLRFWVLIAVGLFAFTTQAQPSARFEAVRVSRRQSQGIMRQSGDRSEARRRALGKRWKRRDEVTKRMQQGALNFPAQRMPAQRARPRRPSAAATAVSDNLTTRLPVQSNDPATSHAQSATTATATVTTTTAAQPVALPQAGGPAGPVRDLVGALPAESRQLAVEKLQAMPAQERLRLRREIEAVPAGERSARLMKILGFEGMAAPDRLSTVAQAILRDNPALEPYLAPPRGTPYVVQPVDAKQRQFRPSVLGGLPPTGQPAPAFTLETLDGKTVSSDAFRGKPLVIEFGSITCPVSRGNIRAMNRLAEAAGDRAAFLLVYTVEAHPHGSASPYSDAEWVPDKNVRDGVLRPQPTDKAGRMALAREAVEKYGVRLPVAVDSMDNTVWSAFGGRPNSAFVIDAEGRIVVAQEWLDPEQVQVALETLAGGPRWTAAP